METVKSFRKVNIYYYDHKGPKLDPTLSQMNSLILTYSLCSKLKFIHRIIGFLDFSYSVIPSLHMRMETDPVSETSFFYSKNIGRWKRSKKPIILCAIHHRQNPINSTKVCPLLN
jgi:hypothetical protein